MRKSFLSAALAAFVTAAGFISSAAAGNLNYPYGLTVDQNGALYVANFYGGIARYDQNLNYQNTITTNVSYPHAVGVGFGGAIYVANLGSNNVTVYNQFGTQINTFSDASLSYPWSLTVDADNNVWVLDLNGVVHPYLDTGTALPAYKTGGASIGS